MSGVKKSEIISLVEALHQLESGAACDVVFVKYDKTRPQKCGKLSRYQVQFMGRSANDFKNYTRHVRILQNGEQTAIIREIHPPLMVEFNGKSVVV